MSVLLDALRRAEEVGAQPTPAAEADSQSFAGALRREAHTLVAAAEPARDPRRMGVAVALVAASAVLIAAAAWWWLHEPPSAPPAVAPPTVQVEDPPLAGGGESDAKSVRATLSPDVVDAPVRKHAPRSAQLRPELRPPVATAEAMAEARESAAPDGAVRRGEPIELPLAQAYAAWRAGRLQEAEQLYRQTIAIDARQPDALLGLAAIAEARGERAEAAAQYRRVLQLEPDHPVALAALAELSAGGDVAAQESVLRQALARRPQAAPLHTALGRLLAAQQRWSEAYQAFASAWQLEPSSAERAYDLAVALDRLRKPQSAAQMYAHALAHAGPGAGFDPDAARERLAVLKAANAAEGR